MKEKYEGCVCEKMKVKGENGTQKGVRIKFCTHQYLYISE